MNKNYREYIGRLARYDQSGRSSIFINRMNIIQYNVKTLLLPDAATSFVTGFGNLLSDFSDDIYAGDDARIDNFEAFMENQLFIFKVQTKNVNGMEVRSMTDVHLVPVPKSFDQSTEFYAVPVFCSKNDEEVRDWEYNKSWNLYRNYDTRAEFLADIKVGEQLGSLYGYDIESSAPAFVLWRDADGKLFAVGSIESAETDPVGACVLQGKYLFTIDMSEYIENFVYDDSYNPCVSYVPADIYRKIDNQLKSAVLQAEKDEEEARQKAAAERAAAEAALREAEAAGRREESAAEETEDTASQSAVGQELKEQLDETELEKIATTEKNEALIFDMMEYYAQKSRCYYKRSDFVNFHTAVKCSDLVILSGLSGTGKSSLVNVYAKALGLNASADLEDSQMLMVPVRPSWSDDADLLGYVDLAHMVYHAADSGFVDFLVRAQREENKNKLFLVCFEEMNLARVEHYFSQFLSILERPAGQRELQLYDKQYMGKLYNAADYPFQIEIGNNVKFIGTVNIDETTHHFSDKVLDRANVIELEVLNYATEWQDKTFAAVGKTQIWSTQDYEKLIVKEQIPNAREVRSLLWEVHCALQSLSPKYGAGPRVVKNVLKYLSNLPKEEALDFDRALDLQLVQRVLTKLRGVESVVGPALQENGEGSLLAVLDKYQSLSQFAKSRALLAQKKKEVESYGYCN
ncbi:hypothetical protein HMPREF9623_01600 [Stomatobaculum longum]|uniref:ATPase dynein-related AAA domain-containing protein n=1 Tax=Stomatobaculum longum TaxID=796942 RepID=A0AA36Y419_9FIRM|nr:hypothetical protein [Stomatobaculum longum]EHO16054.1 hypothetical protein HMPREF9623_01600 [Stomatobaculum longum]